MSKACDSVEEAEKTIDYYKKEKNTDSFTKRKMVNTLSTDLQIERL